METSVIIRPATDTDMGKVARIFGHYVDSSVVTFETVPPDVAYWEKFRADQADRGLPFLVCSVDGQVAGYAYAAPWRAKPAYRHTVEGTVYLAPGWTGQGFGRRLLTELQRSCSLAGAEQMIAVIADSGDPSSAALHRACGFTEAGRLRGVGCKHGRMLDTTLMQCSLAASSDGPASSSGEA